MWQYDGAPNDDFLPYLIDLTNEPSIDLPLFETGVPENPWNPEARELSYVPGSNKAVAYVYGLQTSLALLLVFIQSLTKKVQFLVQFLLANFLNFVQLFDFLKQCSK